jgi:alpha-glutamyl/putrescinyl thymine pyrophosphorylase clade 1
MTSNAGLAYVRRQLPSPRLDIYPLYWRFASERHAAFERRLAGLLPPWTNDPILQVYKFCNVYRAADRVSQYMIRDVAYGSDAGDVADRVFQIVAFRTFSNIATWETLKEVLGGSPTIGDLVDGRFEHALTVAKRRNGKLYTGAFILCANKAFGHDEKHKNHVALFKHMFLASDFAIRALRASSLESLVNQLQSFPLMGPFMAYQTAIDLNYSGLFEFDENDYTQAGPGALRGLRKAFVSLGDYSAADTIRWMVEQQNTEFVRLELPFAGLFGRPLHAIDCQGLFCELDKYCREAAPHLASNRSRIKAKFVPQAAIRNLFLPPKWHLMVPAPSDTYHDVPARNSQYELRLSL